MKPLIFSTSFLAVSLGAAWMQFTTEPDKVGENEVLVMANQPSYIEQIDWVSDKQEVHVEQRSDDLGNYLWVKYVENKIPEEPSEKYFMAGANGTKLLEALSPLVAIRKLESDVDSTSLGLQEPSATLRVKSNGTTRLFSIGDEAYGTKDLYVRDDASQEIFLIDDSKLRNLRQARTSLPNRALFPQPPKEALSASLNWNEQTLQFKHQNAHDAKNAQWIYAEKPEIDATQVETWLSKVLRISVSRSAAPNEDLTTLESHFTISLQWGDGYESTTTYARMTTDDSWWAKNTFTRGYVRVSGKALTALVEDIPSLFEE